MAENRSVLNGARYTFRSIQSPFIIGILILYLFRVAPQIVTEDLIPYHPITDMISNSKVWHEKWRSQASTSRTLEDAVNTYEQRYGRHPPPYVTYQTCWMYPG
jgi:hypothetical protein